MTRRASSTPHADGGFTLPELLVVMVVIGILAAIAIPTFLGQREKAHDADAKSLAAAGAHAMEAYHVEHDDYDATRAAVLAIAPELDDAAAWALTAGATTYRLSVTSASGTKFTVGRPSEDAPIQHTCDSPGDAGCGDDGHW